MGTSGAFKNGTKIWDIVKKYFNLKEEQSPKVQKQIARRIAAASKSHEQ